jgi:hypothetical protein
LGEVAPSIASQAQYPKNNKESGHSQIQSLGGSIWAEKKNEYTKILEDKIYRLGLGVNPAAMSRLEVSTETLREGATKENEQICNKYNIFKAHEHENL